LVAIFFIKICLNMLYVDFGYFFTSKFKNF
jgi:hypothetical protein